MTRLVTKFGGTSCGDVGRIQAIAARIQACIDAGHEVAVVVSAMGAETDRLVALARATAPLHDTREYDTVVSTGEQLSAALLAMALNDCGVSARSWLGWQLPIHTSGAHGRARIESIDTAEIEKRMAAREVPVIAGFQGLGPRNRVTTLGRGGSDATAVALAAALQAERCDIYTDVDGVYTADPRVVSSARKLDKITYEEMMEMASLGAKILQLRSVEMAMNHRVRLQVLSSFNDVPGTLIVDEGEIVEHHVVSAITSTGEEAKISVLGVPEGPGVLDRIFGPLGEANINIDMIMQDTSADGSVANVIFTVSRHDLDHAIRLLEAGRADIDFKTLLHDARVAKVSAIGVGMRSHPGVAQRMFAALGDKGINIEAITTSEIKISVLIREEYTELAVRTLHAAYGLDAD